MVWPTYQAGLPYYYVYDILYNNQNSRTIM
ncbi:hypothetical protein CFP56_011464 [Quercus suber]|uniref:Uncharacterized protein n=1 Tax=Quercus suber TaxID=58331 RepID=A0AAW0M7A7_QUESU